MVKVKTSHKAMSFPKEGQNIDSPNENGFSHFCLVQTNKSDLKQNI